MSVYTTKLFAKWAKQEKITSQALLDAVDDMSNGLFEANLGGNIYKKRVALPSTGKGKSGGARTILAFKSGCDTFFLYAFNKKAKDNVNKKELIVLKALGKVYLDMTEAHLKIALKEGELLLVERNNDG